MGKENGMYTHSGILYGLEKEGGCGTLRHG